MQQGNIPPLRSFRLFINNREENWSVADPFNERTVISSTMFFNLDPNEYEEERTSFTINELLNGMGPSNVSIDVNNRIISCSIQHPRRLTRRPMEKPISRPKELSLSMKIRNCPSKMQSFPAALLIDGNGIPTQQYPVEFSRKNGYYACNTTIDNSLANQNVTIKVVANGIMEMTKPATRLLNNGANDITVEFEKYFKKVSNFATTINHNKKSILGVGVTTIALLLAGIIFLGIRGKDGEGTNGENGPIVQDNGQKKQVKGKQAPKLAEFIKESEESLKEDSLLFATIEDIHNKYQEYLKDDKYKNEKVKLGESVAEFGEKIEMYHHLVEIINKRTDNIAAGDSLKKLKKYIYESGELKNECDKLIDKKHLDYINILFKGKVDHEWKPKDSDKEYQSAKILYGNSSFDIKSFKDFEKIADEVKKSTASNTSKNIKELESAKETSETRSSSGAGSSILSN